jgi:hypothetical protein
VTLFLHISFNLHLPPAEKRGIAVGSLGLYFFCWLPQKFEGFRASWKDFLWEMGKGKGSGQRLRDD